jgi:hypothetical protein
MLAAAVNTTPLAPLLVNIELPARQYRHIGVGRRPVLEIALVGIIAR